VVALESEDTVLLCPGEGTIPHSSLEACDSNICEVIACALRGTGSIGAAQGLSALSRNVITSTLCASLLERPGMGVLEFDRRLVKL
jgi:hypothetical protein